MRVPGEVRSNAIHLVPGVGSPDGEMPEPTKDEKCVRATEERAPRCPADEIRMATELVATIAVGSHHRSRRQKVTRGVGSERPGVVARQAHRAVHLRVVDRAVACDSTADRSTALPPDSSRRNDLPKRRRIGLEVARPHHFHVKAVVDPARTVMRLVFDCALESRIHLVPPAEFRLPLLVERVKRSVRLSKPETKTGQASRRETCIRLVPVPTYVSTLTCEAKVAIRILRDVTCQPASTFLDVFDHLGGGQTAVSDGAVGCGFRSNRAAGTVVLHQSVEICASCEGRDTAGVGVHPQRVESGSRNLAPVEQVHVCAPTVRRE